MKYHIPFALGLTLLSFCGQPDPILIVLYGASTANGAETSQEYDLDLKILEGDAFVKYNPEFVGVEAGLSDLENVYVVKYGIPSSAISCEKDGDCLSEKYLAQMEEKIQKAKDLLGVPVTAYIWMKGAGGSNYGTTYERDFLKIQNDFFDKFGKAPWISGLPKQSPDKIYDDLVREIHLKYSDFTVDLNDFETVDDTHPTESEYVRIGKIMAEDL